jgi:hypothetical protein
VCEASGVMTAKYVVGTDIRVVDEALKNLSFPMFVKCAYLDNSEGLTNDSIV